MLLSEIVTNAPLDGLNPVQFGQEQCAPGHSYGPAVRTHWLLHYVVSGCGYFEKDGITHSIHPGDMFIIAPYEETFYKADIHNPWNYIWLGFTASKLPCPLHMPYIHKPALGAIFSDAARCCNMDQGKSAFLSAKLWEIFACLLDEKQTEPDYIDRAILCMEVGYADGITVSEIAKQLNLNRSYFSTIFKEKTGCSPQQYLNNLRTEKAVELMVKHKKSPSIAAMSTGYSDLYHFSRMFKRHTGLSPTEYIKTHSHVTKKSIP